jgi:hypothetical protein
MTSQVEVELPTFTIAPLERSSELYWKLDAGSIEHGHGHALHQSVARAESSLSMIEEGRVQGGFYEEETGARFTRRNSLWDGNCAASRPGLRPRYSRLATRALLRGSRARHLLSSNARTAMAGSRASRSRPTSSRSQSKTPYPAA